MKQLNLSLTHFRKFYKKTGPSAILSDYAAKILCLVALPNDQLASGSDNRTIELWSLSSKSCTDVLIGHTSDVYALAALPHDLLASGSRDKTIKFWDLNSKSCIATLVGHISDINALTALSNGLLARGSGDKTIKLWDLASKSCIATLAGHISDINALTALSNGLLASGSWDRAIKLWDVNSKSCITTLAGRISDVNALTVLPNGFLASGGSVPHCFGKIELWDAASGFRLTTLNGHRFPVSALSLFSNGLLASGAENGTVMLWNPKIVSLSTQLLRPILKALQTNSSVSYLDLSGNADISDDILGPLTEIFKPGFWSSLWSRRQPNTTLKALNLQNTGVTRNCIRELRKATRSHPFSVDIYSDEDLKWGMICFLLSFFRANRNSPIVASGLDLCIEGEFGRLFGIPSGWFTRSAPNPVPIPRKDSSCSIQ